MSLTLTTMMMILIGATYGAAFIEDLLAAIENDKVKEVYNMIGKIDNDDHARRQVNMELSGKSAPLIIAARLDAEKTEMFRQVLDLPGIKVDVRDSVTGNTALIVAAQRGNCQRIIDLIHKRANVNVMNENHETALIVTQSTVASSAITDELLKAGAVVNVAENTRGHTALMLATNIACMKALISAGADPNTVDLEGKHALSHAANRSESSMSISTLLAAGANVNHPDHQNHTALLIALLSGKEESARAILNAANVNVNVVSSIGISPLMISIEKDYTETINAILDLNVDINYQYEGRTALMMLSRNSAIDTVKKIITKFPEIALNAIDKQNFTAIDIAANNHEWDVVKYLMTLPSISIGDIVLKNVIECYGNSNTTDDEEMVNAIIYHPACDHSGFKVNWINGNSTVGKVLEAREARMKNDLNRAANERKKRNEARNLKIAANSTEVHDDAPKPPAKPEDSGANGVFFSAIVIIATIVTNAI